MAGSLPPGLAGFVAAQDRAERASANNMAMLSGGLGIMQNMRQMQFEDMLKPLQLQQLQQSVEQAKQKQAALQAFANRAQGGGQQAAVEGMNQGAQVGDIGPTITNAARAPSGGILGYSPADLVPLKATGTDTSDYLKIWEAMNPTAQIHNGYAFNPRQLQHGQALPGVQVTPQGQGVQTTIGPGGLPQLSPMAGSLDTFRQFKTVEAGLDPFMGELDANDRPIPQTRAGFAQRYSGAPATAELPQLRTAAPTAEDALRIVQQADAKGQGASVVVGGQSLPALPGNASTGNASTLPALPGEPPATRQGMGMSPGERSAAQASGKNDAELANGFRQKIPTLNGTLRRLDRLEALNGNDQTFAAGGAEFKTQLSSIAQGLGLDVNRTKTANSEEYLAHIAELLKDRLASKDYGSGTGVSNVDLLAARAPLPDLIRTQQGRSQILQAVRADTQRALEDSTAARAYFDKNLTLRGFSYPSEYNNPMLDRPAVDKAIRDARPTAQSPTPQRSSFDSLPIAREYSGRSITDNVTGIKYRSDGNQWQRMQ